MALKDLLSRYENTNNKQGNDNKTPFFVLKNNGDTAQVRFLVKDVADLEQYVFETHRVKIGDYENKVACIGKECVCCREGRPSLRVYLPVWNINTNQLEMWERGIADIKSVMNLIEKYGKKFGELYNCVFEIKRNGAKGDNNTTYSIMFEDNDPVDNVDTLKADIPKLVGRNFRYILDLDATQQADAILTGTINWNKETKDEDAF